MTGALANPSMPDDLEQADRVVAMEPRNGLVCGDGDAAFEEKGIDASSGRQHSIILDIRGRGLLIPGPLRRGGGGAHPGQAPPRHGGAKASHQPQETPPAEARTAR